eukprot:gene26922-35619_t
MTIENQIVPLPSAQPDGNTNTDLTTAISSEKRSGNNLNESLKLLRCLRQKSITSFLLAGGCLSNSSVGCIPTSLQSSTIDESLNRSLFSKTRFVRDPHVQSHPLSFRLSYHRAGSVAEVSSRRSSASILYDSIADLCASSIGPCEEASFFGEDRSVDGTGSKVAGIDPGALRFDSLGVLFAAGSRSGTVQVYDFDEYIHRERAQTEDSAAEDEAAPSRQLRPVRTLRARREVSSVAWSSLNPDLLAVGYRFVSTVHLFLLTASSPLPKRELEVGGGNGPGGGGGSAQLLEKQKQEAEERLLAGSTRGMLRCWAAAGSAEGKQRDRAAACLCLWEVRADPHRAVLHEPVLALHLLRGPGGAAAAAAVQLVAALGSLVFSVWDLQRLDVPALGSRPQPTCLLRLDLNQSATLCCSLSGARLPCVLVSFRSEATATKKNRPPAMRGVSCLAASAPDVALTWLRYGGLGIPRQLSPAVCLSGWPGRLCLLNTDDNVGMSRLSVRSLRWDGQPPGEVLVRQPLPLRPSGHGFALSLPGILLSARPGDREVVSSHSLERYLCPAGAAAASARSRSPLLQFSWRLGGDSEEKDRDRDRQREVELLGATDCQVCSSAVEELAPGRLVLLSQPYLGPLVVHGSPRVRMQTCLQPSWDPNLTSPVTAAPVSRERSLGWACSAVVPHPQLPYALLARADDSIQVLRSQPQPRSEEPEGQGQGERRAWTSTTGSDADRMHHYHCRSLADPDPDPDPAPAIAQQDQQEGGADENGEEPATGAANTAPPDDGQELGEGGGEEEEEGLLPESEETARALSPPRMIDSADDSQVAADDDGSPVNDENLPPPEPLHPQQQQKEQQQKEKEQEKAPALLVQSATAASTKFFSIFSKQAAQGPGPGPVRATAEKRKLEEEEGGPLLLSRTSSSSSSSVAGWSRSVFPPQQQQQQQQQQQARKMAKVDEGPSAAARPSPALVRCVSSVLNPRGLSGAATAARSSSLSLSRKKPS